MTLETEFLFEAEGQLAEPLELGVMPNGLRRVVQILGGTFQGPRMRGTMVPDGAADWQYLRSDSVMVVEAHYALRTDDGALIYVVNRGLRHAPDEVTKRMLRGEDVPEDAYYFRCVPQFEAPAGRYDWLNKRIFVGTGLRYPSGIRLRIYQLL
jgi:hypothetical protein